VKESKHQGTDPRNDVPLSDEGHIVEDFDTEYSTYSEFEESYDDVCVASSQEQYVERM
jgi:hypothetical protein